MAKKVTVPEPLGLELEPMTVVVAFWVLPTICDNEAVDAERAGATRVGRAVEDRACCETGNRIGGHSVDKGLRSRRGTPDYEVNGPGGDASGWRHGGHGCGEGHRSGYVRVGAGGHGGSSRTRRRLSCG